MLLVTVGNIMVATAQWYLIWLFARHAGPQAVGVYSSLVAFMTPLFVIAQLGLRNLYITLQTSVRWPVYLAVRTAGWSSRAASPQSSSSQSYPRPRG
ncbi:hypothetical protein IOD13_15030 [Brevibacterium casei]|nr:hypothetical protein [Brevibacterium casei]